MYLIVGREIKEIKMKLETQVIRRFNAINRVEEYKRKSSFEELRKMVLLYINVLK